VTGNKKIKFELLLRLVILKLLDIYKEGSDTPMSALCRFYTLSHVSAFCDATRHSVWVRLDEVRVKSVPAKVTSACGRVKL